MIESLQNEKVKLYAKLNNKKYRNELNLFVASGHHLVTEALKKNIVKEILLLNGEENVYGNVTYVTSEILKKISGLDNAPKVLAICHKCQGQDIKGNVIMLDDISDPGNLGTIIRTAVAFNYDTIILSSDTVDVYNPKVIRATEGMIFHINIIQDNLSSKIMELKDKGYLIYGTDVRGKSNIVLDKTKKHALIIGSEASGIKKDLLSLCDVSLCIKINPNCESLNAAVAAGILMYELTIQSYSSVLQ
ncbi:MAG: RNA methyltransferase [Mollicutes bacterium]|nr:RNA methyltransferase [Mollicutes bacterium]